MKGEVYYNEIGLDVYSTLRRHMDKIDEDDLLFILIRLIFSQIQARQKIQGTPNRETIKIVYDTLNVMDGENS